MQIPEKLLKQVEKPARYVGGEWGQTLKDKTKTDIRFAFCFPDTYEIGMSNLGIRILYDVLNDRTDTWCERCYAPWVDMEKVMRDNKIPLFALESGDPIADFDFIGFTLQFELCYTNMLNMLSLAGVPLRTKDRTGTMPIVVCGGPCTYNAEPVADFIDICIIGEGEEVLDELMTLYAAHKKAGFDRAAFLHAAARELTGIYVPSLYDVTYNADGTVEAFHPLYDDIPAKIQKRIIRDMDKARFPEKLTVPYIDTVHDRIMLEVYRGCIRGCRFCQAGMIYRPVREKSPEVLCRQGQILADCTGYDEISLISLSISDYSHIDELTDKLLAWTNDRNISLSLPSLRADSFTKELMDKVSSVRTGGLTFAPEAGTQRLRDVINKNLEESDLMHACSVAFAGGKDAVKLYFMQGLPTETDEDLDGIHALCERVIDCYYHTEGRPKRPPTVTISAACFIPKPFTPFQWEAQCDMEELARKQAYLSAQITNRKIRYNYHDARVSRLEAVFARGNRKLCDAVEEAVKRGITFDSWEERFDYDAWMRVFDDLGIDPAFYANRVYKEDEVLPWDIIDIGVTKEFLLRERHRAYEGKTTENCRHACNGCGADRLGGERTCCPKAKK